MTFTDCTAIEQSFLTVVSNALGPSLASLGIRVEALDSATYLLSNLKQTI